MKRSAHWYKHDGTSCHEMPNKSKPGTSRPTSLRDARSLNLLPSVSGILDILDKPQLQDWKLEQMTKEFQRRMKVLSRSPGVDAFAGIMDIAERDPDQLHDDLVDRAFAQVEDAADAGTAIHKAIECELQGLAYDADALILLPELKESFKVSTFVDPVRQFVRENQIRPTGFEVRCVNLPHGYAGTGDLPMYCTKGTGFGDWKTRKTKPGKPVMAYDGQVMQIGAYHAAHYGIVPEINNAICGFNLFISTTEPGRVEAVWYSAKEITHAYHAFTHMAALWRHLKGYDPRPAPYAGTL